MSIHSTPVVPSAHVVHSAVPPHLQLIQMGVAIWQARAVYAAAELGLADLLADGARGADELAAATSTHEPSLYRLLRALAACGLFTEVSPHCFAATDLGKALRTGAPGAARATILTIAGRWQWKAWDHVLDALRTGESGVTAAFGTGLFDFLAQHPEDSARFNEAMVGMHGGLGPAVAAAYDFSRFGTLVDVGGGKGALIAALLRANPALRGVLFDLPETGPAARQYLSATDLSSRCDVVEGDFFREVPAGHDAYVLAHVLHDWTDEQSIAILRNCRAAAGPDTRLLILEAVLPEGDTPHHGKLMDLLMLTVTGGMERTEAQFAGLLRASAFRLVRVCPTATHQSIVEAVPV